MGKDSDPDKWDYPPHTRAKHVTDDDIAPYSGW